MTNLEMRTAGGWRQVCLADYLDADAGERAHEEAYRWIKQLRHARVDNVPFRTRFALRGDSLWWFAELYLHKQQAILNLMRTLAAFDALVERERPQTIRVLSDPSSVVGVAARARGIALDAPGRVQAARRTVARLEARARALRVAASLSRFRANLFNQRGAVGAVFHRAFWRTDAADGSAESYIGPILRELETRIPPNAIHYIGIGPRHNFQARRWWQALAPGHYGTMVPIERYAPRSALAASTEIWTERHEVMQSLWNSSDVREHAIVQGCDCWPVISTELAGIALLQFPWSARAMDEAAAALEAVEPDVAITYAEAGGWGRALALECRRRNVPLAGLQHGFIYRHWLNYRHEPDEMRPDPLNPGDAGFPRPSVTLLFDDYAAEQFLTAGHFPRAAVAVSGSARLDDLIASVRRESASAIAETRASTGVTAGGRLVLLAAKYREAAPHLDALVGAVARMPGVQLAIKTHPAETPEVYARAARGAPNVRILPADASLARLLAGADAVVTVNSTVAVDALALGLPSLVIGLPNNLSPFVDSGVMAGAATGLEIYAKLERLLYDEEFRTQIAHASRDFLGRHHPVQDGRAAARAADAILALAGVMGSGCGSTSPGLKTRPTSTEKS